MRHAAGFSPFPRNKEVLDEKEESEGPEVRDEEEREDRRVTKSILRNRIAINNILTRNSSFQK